MLITSGARFIEIITGHLQTDNLLPNGPWYIYAVGLIYCYSPRLLR